MPYAKSVDFAKHKEAGAPCQHLNTNYRCRIHRQLRDSGYRGCTVYEIMYYLNEALHIEQAESLHPDLEKALEETERLTNLPPTALLELQVQPHRISVNQHLLATSQFVREAYRSRINNRIRRQLETGRELIGAKLRGAELKGSDLRDANLSGCLFLTQAQLNAAKGNKNTILPAHLETPAHWMRSLG